MRISDWSSDVCSSDLYGDASTPYRDRMARTRSSGIASAVLPLPCTVVAMNSELYTASSPASTVAWNSALARSLARSEAGCDAAPNAGRTSADVEDARAYSPMPVVADTPGKSGEQRGS